MRLVGLSAANGMGETSEFQASDQCCQPAVDRTGTGLSGLWPVQISDHSSWTFSSPRSRNWRKPRPGLIWPKTGSTVSIRRA